MKYRLYLVEMIDHSGRNVKETRVGLSKLAVESDVNRKNFHNITFTVTELENEVIVYVPIDKVLTV